LESEKFQDVISMTVTKALKKDNEENWKNEKNWEMEKGEKWLKL
jgi:hypothetical protein